MHNDLEILPIKAIEGSNFDTGVFIFDAFSFGSFGVDDSQTPIFY